MHDIVNAASNFIDLNWINITYLFFVGFVGGLVSGFIGSGGAFVLTPAMMSLGVPGLIAVASNMCHKFPKALVGAIKRAKYGQVDWKLGLVMGVSGEAGVLYGAHIQEGIKKTFGDAGSNLYVSAAFVVILAVVGGFVIFLSIFLTSNNFLSPERFGLNRIMSMHGLFLIKSFTTSIASPVLTSDEKSIFASLHFSVSSFIFFSAVSLIFLPCAFISSLTVSWSPASANATAAITSSYLSSTPLP